MTGYTNKNIDKSIGIGYMHQRLKPCLILREGNVETKLASFNNSESARLFIDSLAEIFNLEKTDWTSDDLPVGFRTDDWSCTR